MFQKRSPITHLSLISSREKEPVIPSLDGNEGCGLGTAQMSAQEGPGWATPGPEPTGAIACPPSLPRHPHGPASAPWLLAVVLPFHKLEPSGP